MQTDEEESVEESTVCSCSVDDEAHSERFLPSTMRQAGHPEDDREVEREEQSIESCAVDMACQYKRDKTKKEDGRSL
jgi:hypothetical protein